MIHARAMGDFGDPDAVQVVAYRWEYARRQRKLCPVCLDVIADKSTTCRRCAWEWKKIRSRPDLLAWWIVWAAGVPELRGVKVWERDDQAT